jgi:hypothetical protein
VIRNLLLIALFALTGTAFAEVVDISFPELTGDYQTGWLPPINAPASKTTSFSFPLDVQSMDGLRFVISGDWVEGVIICANLWGPPDTTSFTPALTMYLRAPDAFDGVFHASVHLASGSSTLVSPTLEYLYPPGGEDINLLLGTEIFVELACEHLLLDCHAEVDSYGTLTEVRLEAFGAVPTDEHSWGAVKSLFR